VKSNAERLAVKAEIEAENAETTAEESPGTASSGRDPHSPEGRTPTHKRRHLEFDRDDVLRCGSVGTPANRWVWPTSFRTPKDRLNRSREAIELAREQGKITKEGDDKYVV